MSRKAVGGGFSSRVPNWLRGLWTYYREYTATAVHAATTAAMTAFGLLVFVDRLFAVLAIASYVLPPVVLYTLDGGAGATPREGTESPAHTDSRTGPGTGLAPDIDTDSDSDDGDTDSDTDG